MLKIYVITPWKKEVEYNFWRKQSPNRSGRWKNLVLTDRFDEADVYVAFWLDGAAEEFRKCPPHSVLNFMREPSTRRPGEAYLSQPWVRERTLHSRWVTEGPNPQVWWMERSYSELNSQPFPDKTELVSCVMTDRGHPRVTFIEEFMKAYPGVLHLYGRNWEEGGPCPAWRRFQEYGGPIIDKWNGLAPYRYAFALENVSDRNEWDTSLNDPILAGCMPLYWGCSNLSDYLPEDSYVWLDITKPTESVHKAMAIIRSDYRERHIEALYKAKDLILNKYQVWPTVHHVLAWLCSEDKAPRSICNKLWSE